MLGEALSRAAVVHFVVVDADNPEKRVPRTGILAQMGNGEVQPRAMAPAFNLKECEAAELVIFIDKVLNPAAFPNGLPDKGGPAAVRRVLGPLFKKELGIEQHAHHAVLRAPPAGRGGRGPHAAAEA